MKILAATSNEGKLAELRRMLAAAGVEVIGLADLIVPAADVEEDGATFEENATKKARTLALHAGLVTVGDDSGLEVDALGGAPGVRSARYSGGGPSANVDKLLEALERVPDAERTARFRCVIALVDPRRAEEAAIFTGVCEGRVIRERRGTGGFGYDPVLVPAGETRTISEMGDAEKDAISHRGAAVRGLVAHLRAQREARAAAPPARLVTIPFSHFCEKARWALDRAEIRYEEDGHVPLLSWGHARGAGGSRQVPVLVAGARVLRDSTEILRFADAHGHAPPLFAPGDDATDALESLCDEKVGPAVRRIAYHHLLADGPLMARVFSRVGGGGLEGRLARVLRPLIARGIRRGLKIDAAGVARSWASLEAALARIEARLSEAPYLSGARFGAADLAFAALFAPFVWPEAYARTCAPEDELPEAFRALIAAQRARPAGRHALRLYRLHR